MTVNEMISKFRLQLVEQNGEPAIKVRVKPTAKQITELKAAKPEIIAELQLREQVMAEREAKRKAEEAAEREAIVSGKENIQLRYSDGEYLSGWTPVGQSADILKELSLVKHVSGWGLYVEPKTLEELGGPVFTYRQALELSQVREQAKETKRQEKEAERQAKFDKARETRKPVLLRRWSTDCCDRNEECSMDVHTEYAMPDGSIKHEWTHTW
jgi:hypothetical protein